MTINSIVVMSSAPDWAHLRFFVSACFHRDADNCIQSYGAKPYTDYGYASVLADIADLPVSHPSILTQVHLTILLDADILAARKIRDALAVVKTLPINNKDSVSLVISGSMLDWRTEILALGSGTATREIGHLLFTVIESSNYRQFFKDLDKKTDSRGMTYLKV